MIGPKQMPELPELEALRIRLSPGLADQMVTGVEVNPKKAHLLRYPVEEFAREVPGRRIRSLTRRGKHLVFALDARRSLVIKPMLGGRFPLPAVETNPPPPRGFSLRLEERPGLRHTH